MTASRAEVLGVGMLGYAFMGAAHSQAWRNAPSFFSTAVHPDLTVICGRNAEAAEAVAERFGWRHVETDWRKVLTRDDVDVIDICTPGDLHAEMAIAALEAGKHVLCEKPLANSVAEAEAMTEAANRAAERGVRSMVGFTYRRVPAIVLARQLIAEGRIGTVRHVRAQYLQDWIVDPEFPLVWRLQRSVAGAGSLGDIGAHIIDLTQYLLDDRIAGLSALTETFIKTRPLPEASSGLVAQGGSGRGEVDVDDAALFIARFVGGAVATYEATRFATGRKNAIRVEVNGSAGSVAFDFEDMNVLEFFDGTEDARTAGFRRILVTEGVHPYVGAWWPPGHIIGYEHGFTHQAVDFLNAIAEGRDPEPSFADGLQVQRVLAAVEESAAKGSNWVDVPGALA